MSSKISFPPRLPLPSRYLPLTLISLEDWALVTLRGVDTAKYLQGQLTCDVISLDADHFSFAAHCNDKGKMFSYLCLFHYRDGMAFIERRSVRDRQLVELKKYAVFSKTTITADDNAVLLGVAGFQAQATLEKFFTSVPNVVYSVSHCQGTTLLYFNLPASRFLLITKPSVCNILQRELKGQIQLNNSRQWLALDIEAGYPVIDSANSVQFIPQAANVQALNGINFDKGCYLGQEMITRIKYRGANKRALYWLAGKTNHIPLAGDNLELKIGNGWRKTGTVLAACQLDDDKVWIQAVLNNNLTQESTLRIHNDDNGILFVQPLPYITSV